ncbi:MAG: hypothetical protein HZB50_18945 [Chloroflexi bacterium]|nr:hypothetical protein [Chloroflexota bacterium]
MSSPELPFPFSIIFKHGWVLFIGFTLINAFTLKFRSKKYIEQNPALEEGYEKLFRGYVIFMNLPWVVLGIGMIFGRFNSLFDVMFGFRSGNIFTLLFLGTVIALWILSVIWIYFLNGAEFLVEYPGVFNSNIKSPLMIKIWFALSLMGGILGLIFMLNMAW